MQELVSALEAKDFITGITPIMEGSKEVGYTIAFEKSTPISIRHGVDAQDGITPIIGVKQFIDGKYYWTVQIGQADPTYILDEEGNKIPASGTDGEAGATGPAGPTGPTGPTGPKGDTPQISVAEFEGVLYWKVDNEWLLDNGAKVPATGAQGDAIFAKDGVDTSDPDNVTFTLADGTTKITLPRKSAVTVAFDSYQTFFASRENNKVTLVFPATLKKGDFTAMTAAVTNENGTGMDIQTRSAATDKVWGVKVTLPEYNAEDKPVAGSSYVTLTAPENIALAETALLKVTIVDSKGREQSVTRPVKYFEGAIGTSTAGGLNAAGIDPSVTRLALKGSIDATDFEYIRTTLTALEVLDLSMTDLASMPDRGLAFNEAAPNTTLRRVILPESVGGIEEAAFVNCQALEYIDAGNPVQIGQWAFQGCSALRRIDLGDRLETVLNSAFYHCTSLSQIEFPKSTRTLGRWIFEGCSNLETVVLNEGLETLSQSTFYGSGIYTLRIPSTVSEIPDWTFEACPRLTNIRIPATVTTLGQGAFYGCTQLASVDIDPGITVVPADCFYMCHALSHISLPDQITEIQNDAFAQCDNLVLGKLPASLEVIGRRAFASCNNMNSVDFPDGLKRIEQSAFNYVPMERIELPASLESLADCAFYWENRPGTILFEGTTPPTVVYYTLANGDLSDWMSRETMAGWTVKVPSGAVAAYKASEWGSGTTAYGNHASYFDPNKISAW